jgi:hypothetical protein
MLLLYITWMEISTKHVLKKIDSMQFSELLKLKNRDMFLNLLIDFISNFMSFKYSLLYYQRSLNLDYYKNFMQFQ